jgi:hypothetical protein
MVRNEAPPTKPARSNATSIVPIPPFFRRCFAFKCDFSENYIPPCQGSGIDVNSIRVHKNLNFPEIFMKEYETQKNGQVSLTE